MSGIYRVTEPIAPYANRSADTAQPRPAEENSLVSQMLQLGLFNPPPLPQWEIDRMKTIARKRQRFAAESKRKS